MPDVDETPEFPESTLMTTLRNVMNGELRLFTRVEAAVILAHPWFGRFYELYSDPWAYIDDNYPPVAEWIEDPLHPGYMMEQ